MASQDKLKDKRVVITGASAGVGRATAIAFAKAGAKLVLLARGLDGLAGAKKDVESLGGSAEIYSVDMSDSKEVEETVNKIESDLGPIDVWVNNAMCSVFAPVAEITPEEYKRVTEVTYLGQVYGTMAILKKMRSRNAGKIILIGSALAYRGIPLQSAYCGAKHGVEGFFESLRCELIHEKKNIQLSMIQLPAMNTPQFGWVLDKLPNNPRPMGFVYQPEVAAKAIVFAATHNRRQIYVGWPTFETIIGNKIVPAFFDWYLAKVGYKGQQTDVKVDPNRKNNVWEPVPGDHGAHGTFDDIAHKRSIFLWMVMKRDFIFILLFVILLIVIYFII
jgi:short-subunit dehydrogenase